MLLADADDADVVDDVADVEEPAFTGPVPASLTALPADWTVPLTLTPMFCSATNTTSERSAISNAYSGNVAPTSFGVFLLQSLFIYSRRKFSSPV